MSNEEIVDLDNILDVTIDDLADMPEFKPYPPGYHKVIFNFATKIIENPKRGAVSFDFKYVSLIELADGVSTDEVPKVGDTANVLCIMKNKDGSKNEFSEGLVKMFATALKERFSAPTVTGIFEAAAGTEIAIATSLKHDKKNDVDRMQIVSVSLI